MIGMIIGDLTYRILPGTAMVVIAVFTLCYFSSCDTEKSIYPEGRNTFIKIYGFGRLDVATDMIRDQVTGGFVIAGTTSTSSLDEVGEWESAPDNDAMVIFVDENGNDARYATRFNEGNDLVWQIIQLEDDNFLVVGETDRQTVFLWKMDNQGNNIDLARDTFSIGRGLGVMEYVDFAGISGNRILITGENTTSTDSTEQLLLLLDNQGNLLDEFNIGQNSENFGYRINQGSYGSLTGFYNLRNEKNKSTGETKYLIEFRALGQSGSGEDNASIDTSPRGTSATPLSGEYVDFLFGSDDLNPVDPDIFVLSNNKDFEVEFTWWQHVAGKYIKKSGASKLDFNVTENNNERHIDETEGRSIIRSKSNKYLLNATDLDKNRILIANFETDGVVNWAKTYGSEVGYGLGGDIIELEDGSLVFCGTVNFENNNLKIALYKTDSEGNLDM
ncbi:hypothetical protein ACFLU5_05705 [Bacteroidota bacterium]